MEDRVVIKPILISYQKAFFRSLPRRDEVERLAGEYWEEIKQRVGDEAIVEKPFIFTSLSDFSKLYKELNLDVDALIVLRISRGDHRRIVKFGLLGFPVIFVENSVMYGDVTGYINYYGGRAFFFKSYDEVRRFIKVLKAYRRIKRGIAIIFSSTGLPSFSTIAGGWDIEKIRRRFGIEFVYVTNDQLLKEYENISKEEIQNIYNEVVGRASSIEVSEKNIRRALKLYVAMKRFVQEYEASMLTITCAEDLFYENKVTPCLPLVLFNDEGIPASCEGDLSALLAMTFLAHISEKPAFMGNLYSIDPEKGHI